MITYRFGAYLIAHLIVDDDGSVRGDGFGVYSEPDPTMNTSRKCFIAIVEQGYGDSYEEARDDLRSRVELFHEPVRSLLLKAFL